MLEDHNQRGMKFFLMILGVWMEIALICFVQKIMQTIQFTRPCTFSLIGVTVPVVTHMTCKLGLGRKFGEFMVKQ